MAVNNDKTRVQMTLPTGLVKRIDEVCERACISRSVWIEYTLGMAVDSYGVLLDRTAAAAKEEVPQG